MKKKKYLDLYYKWMEDGKIPYRENETTCGGLCSIFTRDNLFKLFDAEDENMTYWGVGTFWERIDYTGSVETVVLFMAAMNGEL